MIRAVLFDLMGTLLVRDPASDADPSANFYRVMCEAGVGLSEEEFWAVLRDTPPVAATGPTTPFEDRIGRICAAAGVSITSSRAAELAGAVCSCSNSVVRLDPEAAETITAARRLGPVGLVTNYDHPPNIHHLLDRERLRGFFSVVVISGEIGVWKPDPAILHTALDCLLVRPEEAVYVGDSDVDIQAATAAGTYSVLIRRKAGPSDPLRDPHAEESQVRPTSVIQDLSDLPAALQDLPPA